MTRPWQGTTRRMFGQAPQNPYDLNFGIGPIPVRVSPMFWLIAAVLAWRGDGLHFVVIRIACVFLAILVHELGHATVARAFGYPSQIVLHGLGGYATVARFGTWKNIATTIAGPAAGFGLFFLTLIAAFVFAFNEDRISDPTTSQAIDTAITFTLFICFAWNMMNLLPVFPLDGGQISYEFLTWLFPSGGAAASFLLSTVVGGLIAAGALWAQSNGVGFLGLEPLWVGILFGYLAYQSWQRYDQVRRPW